MEDSSSVSFADETVVQAVAELPLLSEELEERPSGPRDSDEPTRGGMCGSIELHFLLVPFGLEAEGIEEPGEVKRKTVSARGSDPPATPNGTKFPEKLNALEE